MGAIPSSRRSPDQQASRGRPSGPAWPRSDGSRGRRRRARAAWHGCRHRAALAYGFLSALACEAFTGGELGRDPGHAVRIHEDHLAYGFLSALACEAFTGGELRPPPGQAFRIPEGRRAPLVCPVARLISGNRICNRRRNCSTPCAAPKSRSAARALKGRIVAVTEEKETKPEGRQLVAPSRDADERAGLEQFVLEQAESVRFVDPAVREASPRR